MEDVCVHCVFELTASPKMCYQGQNYGRSSWPYLRRTMHMFFCSLAKCMLIPCCLSSRTSSWVIQCHIQNLVWNTSIICWIKHGPLDYRFTSLMVCKTEGWQVDQFTQPQSLQNSQKVRSVKWTTFSLAVLWQCGKESWLESLLKMIVTRDNSGVISPLK